MERIEGGELPRNGCATGSTHMPAFPAPARSLPQPRFAPPRQTASPQAPAPQRPNNQNVTSPARNHRVSICNRLHPCLLLDRLPPVVSRLPGCCRVSKVFFCHLTIHPSQPSMIQSKAPHHRLCLPSSRGGLSILHMRVMRRVSSHSTALPALAARLLFLLLGRLLPSQQSAPLHQVQQNHFTLK